MFDFIASHNTPNTVNVYTVLDAQGSAFVNFRDLDYDNSTYPPTMHNVQDHGIVMGQNFLPPNASAFPHEVGHFFGLWHTFVGWEGYDYQDYIGNVPDTLNWTAYDPVADTSYVLLWLVEYADSSNCLISGDLICDTRPDYLSIGFACNANQESDIIQEHPKGRMFRSDGSNYMAYSSCRGKFSGEQIEWMRDVAQGPRNYLLYDQAEPFIPSVDNVTFLFPPNGSTVEVLDSITLEWDEVPGADYYMLEFGRKVNENFYLPIVKNKVLDQTSFTVAVNDQLNYYWKISLIDKHEYCDFLTDTSFFSAATFTGTNEIGQVNRLLIYPNPVSGHVYWQIPNGTSEPSLSDLEIYDMKGQLISRLSGNDHIHTSGLEGGIYMLKLIANDEVFMGRFVISQ